MSRNTPQGNFRSESDVVGGGCSIELKYALSEKLDLGLHLGLGSFGGDGFTSILPTGTYRFSGKKVTPYVGLGLGLRSIIKTPFKAPHSIRDGTKFGFAPRVGVYLGRINLGATYTVIEDASYLQLNLGVRILSRDLKEE